MPAYVRFIANGMPIRGGASAGVRMGWTRLRGLEVIATQGAGARLVLRAEAGAGGLPLAALGGATASRKSAHSGGVNVLLGDGSVRSHAPSTAPRYFNGVISRISAGGRAQLGAELDLLRLDRAGGEIPVMRVLVKGITIVGHEPAAAKGGNDIAMETIVIAHEGMSHPGGLPSMDLTHKVKALLETYDYPGRYAQRFDGVDPGANSKGRVTNWEHLHEFRPGK